MEVVEFEAPEYRSDKTFRLARFRFVGSVDRGFRVERDGAPWLSVGAGYRVYRSLACGVCSTDLDRHLLPFRLPQVTGHEVVVGDGDGRRLVVEINASPAARGTAADCPDCAAGMARHCPRRLVLGIHDLPGGFGPFVLAPQFAVLPVPPEVPTTVATFVEPLAAALRALERCNLLGAQSVAVLGPRKLGMLILAALAARRRQGDGSYEIVAVLRGESRAALAIAMGADRVECRGEEHDGPFHDIVFETSASPDGLGRALRLARREVHVKSTHGRAAGGLGQLTAMVVDELSIERFDEASLLERVARDDARVAWCSDRAAPRHARVVVGALPSELLSAFAPATGGCIGGAELAVVDDLATADAMIRPTPEAACSVLRPGGTILLTRPLGGAVAEAVVTRGVRISTSRCGDFASALAVLDRDPALVAALGSLITHRFPATEVEDAFRAARRADAVKVVVSHGGPAEGGRPGQGVG